MQNRQLEVQITEIEDLGEELQTVRGLAKTDDGHHSL